MKTPSGRTVLVDTIRPGYYHFRCEGLELVVQLHRNGKASIHHFNQDPNSIPVFDHWRDAEKAVFEIFDSAREKQKKKL